MTRAPADHLSSALNDLLLELGLDPAASRLTRQQGPGWMVLPSVKRPQVLVPLSQGAGPMIAERRARGRVAVVRRELARRSLGATWSRRLPLRRLQTRDPALAELLGWLGDPARPAATVGVMVGPPRANRKPVLRLFGADGETWGYAKMGINDLTNQLVEQEIAALTAVGELDLPGIIVPAVLKHGTWRGRSVLLTAALALDADQRQPSELPIAATRTLFTQCSQVDVPLKAATGMALVEAPRSGEGVRLEELGARLMDVVGDRRIPLGASHGDWTPWNMAWSNEDLEVWDWERFATGVPQGFDAVHFEASKVLSFQTDVTEPAFMDTLPRQLERCDVEPVLTTTLLCTYLLAIGRRYARDLERAPAPAVVKRLHWVIRLLGSQIELLEEEGPQ
ncbi:hypothetical protein [Nocardioides sp.]|uniref:hypothetical protein n=1 Tax=Nocardioides sp. TaxID=35761 RepID=UPI003D0F2620